MMTSQGYQPVYDLTRGTTLESRHFGAAAIMDVQGHLRAWLGDPGVWTFTRSSAKPFQLLPFIERQGHLVYNLQPREIALMCASHSATPDHLQVVQEIQAKVGIDEADLMCGAHPPMHEASAREMERRGEIPTPNHNNCSGKHTGMLAFAHLLGANSKPQESPAYLDLEHPVQQMIHATLAEMCTIAPADIRMGTDGCSAPNFALPLQQVALGYARFSDPIGAGLVGARSDACNTIVQSMMAHPDMVAGPGRFDTLLMQVGAGRIFSKGGAEGYQGIGLLPGALGPGSPALGIAVKVADGDARGRALPGVVLEILRQLGALSEADLQCLSSFGPEITITNWRKLAVGYGKPGFQLQHG